MSPLFSLNGRVALVTGASRALADAGALVVLNGRDATTLAHRRAEIEAAGGRAAIAAFDVCDRPTADAAIDDIVARFGKLGELAPQEYAVGRRVFGLRCGGA
jgi:gluconate 5-dehydrogenase